MEAVIDNVERGFRRVWRPMALRGLVSILFGAVLLAWPEISLEAMVLVFGAFAAAHGILGIYAALRTPLPRSRRAWLVVQGAISIAFGVVAFVWTDMTELALLYLVGAWAVAIGSTAVAAGITLPAGRTPKLLLVLEGALSIVFGVVMFASPETGALALVALIAAFAIVIGSMMLAFAFEIRRPGNEVTRAAREAVRETGTSEPAVQS